VPPDQSPYWKPKFLHAAFAQVAATVALFTGHIDPGGWVAATGLTLGIYTAGNVTENIKLKQSEES